MNLKETIDKILEKIDDFQFSINDLDTIHSLHFYNIICLDMTCNPMEINLLVKDKSRDPLVLVYSIDFFDLNFTSKVVSGFEKELNYLVDSNSSQDQIEELLRIRQIFGV
jgi:hypothetical protein